MRNYTFNGVNVKGSEIQARLSKVDLNSDNPRTEESQKLNASRMSAVFADIGYDSSQPIVMVHSPDDRFRVIRGNGRVGGAHLLESSDATRFTEVFGKNGTIPAILLDCPSDAEIAQIMADHNGIDQRKQTLHEKYLSVRNLILRAFADDSKETRKRLGVLHGQSASWAQSYQYLSELEDICLCVDIDKTDWPCNPFDVFVKEALQDDKVGKLRIGHAKELRSFWTTGIDSEFWLALKNLRRYGKVVKPEEKPEETETDSVEKDSAFFASVTSFTPESETIKAVIDALCSRDIERLIVVDTGCVSMEKVIKELDVQESVQEIAENALV